MTTTDWILSTVLVGFSVAATANTVRNVVWLLRSRRLAKKLEARRQRERTLDQWPTEGK